MRSIMFPLLFTSFYFKVPLFLNLLPSPMARKCKLHCSFFLTENRSELMLFSWILMQRKSSLD